MFAADERSHANGSPLSHSREQALPWIQVAPSAPYFATEDGASWTPIGHNDAIGWPSLRPVLRRPDEAEAYFHMLQHSGVTCLRVMLEYAQRNEHVLERPAGHFRNGMIARWDRLFALAARYAIRLLLTPFDTFWMWKRWQHHPYNAANGGPCLNRNRLLIDEGARAAIKKRLAFAIDRWSGSGALFAWDVWNEIHPAYAQDDVGHLGAFITDIATFVRDRERARWGRSHPITVSAFGPMLTAPFGSKELGLTTPDPRAATAVFRHHALDFATVHTYAEGTIDHPANTVDPAIAMGALTRAAMSEIRDRRPFLDSEHGPIHTFKDKHRTLPEHFDDEYFRHVQWAHLASGGAGGGMRWPNRHPHVLTPGMHAAQRALAAFLPLVDWLEFDRSNVTEQVRTVPDTFATFACGDRRQVVAWVLRRHPLAPDGTVARVAVADRVMLQIPGLTNGRFQITAFNTELGRVERRFIGSSNDGVLELELPVARDVAVAIGPPD